MSRTDTTGVDGESWAEANQRYLMAALGAVRETLARRGAGPALFIDARSHDGVVGIS